MPLKCFGKIPRLLLLLHLSREISIVVSIKVLSVGQKVGSDFDWSDYPRVRFAVCLTSYRSPL